MNTPLILPGHRQKGVSTLTEISASGHESTVRIGVFVCDCGTNIAGFVDVPAVVEYAKSLPDVVFVQENMYTCSEAGLSEIIDAIPEHKLNRVIVASCTPRTHAPLFQGACAHAGLNKYLFEFVNIREQCSWVHMKERAKATEKAKELIRMGVARARLLEPQDEIEVPVLRTALVIGGGIAGMHAALSLANQAFEVHLVEKSSDLGGMLRHLYKLYPTDVESHKILNPLVNRVENHPQIHLYKSHTVEHLSGYIGDFEVKLAHVNNDANKGLAESEHTFKVGTIIVATGAEELQPEGLYGYGEYDNVITQLELERILRENAYASEGEGVPALRNTKTIVMIQCAGARDAPHTPELNYCSRICCMVAIKNAKLIKELYPDTRVYILHNGIQAYGADFEDYYRAARERGVRFVKYSPEKPPEVTGTKGKSKMHEKLKVTVYHELLRRTMEIHCELVVLSAPLVAPQDTAMLSKLLKVPLGQDRFFLEAHVKLRPLDFATDGVYLCGTAHGPADVAEATAQALGAAARAAIPMARGFVRPETITPLVDTDKCTACGICVSVCPFGAITLAPTDKGRKAQPVPAACKGCGCCGASCIRKAITMQHYTDAQLLAQGRAALAPGTIESEKPVEVN